jgi:hypothetical protein
MIMLFNQLLAMPHIDYLGKGEMLTNRDVNTFEHILEKYVFCVYGTFLTSFISAHVNMGPTLYMLHLHVYSVYITGLYDFVKTHNGITDVTSSI